MKKSKNLLFLFFLCAHLLSAQKSFNHSFEKFDPATGSPTDWSSGVGRGSTSNYLFSVDSSTAVGGRYCVRLASLKAGGEFGAFSLSFPADFEGKTITLKGSIKTENVSQDG